MILRPATCYLCEKEAEVQISSSFDTGVQFVVCPRCGRYRITPKTIDDFNIHGYKPDVLRLLRTAARRASDSGNPLTVDLESIPILTSGVIPPSDPIEASDDVLQYLVSHTPAFGSHVLFDHRTLYPIFVLRHEHELLTVLALMSNQKWIEMVNPLVPGGSQVTVLPAGYERVRELRKISSASRQAFVAMSFSPSLRAAYDHGMKPGIEDAGFKPLRMDDLHHNECIDDKIRVEIRKSGLVVADFSEERSGVFFEAGYALGLGLQVIWTCQADNFANLSNHFDTRQFNHIKWATLEDLREQLTNRILATVPGAKDERQIR